MPVSNTDPQEAAQALFCAIADYVGAVEAKKAFDVQVYKTYASWKLTYTFGKKSGEDLVDLAYKKIDVNVSLKDIERLLKSDPSWWKSSAEAAKGIITKLHKIREIKKFGKVREIGWQDILYKRGDEDVMGTIAVLFKKAKTLYTQNTHKTPFAQVNKWNPADIYFASANAKTVLKNLESDSRLTYDELNGTISKLIDNGELLPISLKKIKGAQVDVQLENWEKGKDNLHIGFYGVLFKGESQLRIAIKAGGSESLRKTTVLLRHAPEYNKSVDSWKFYVENGTSAAGSLTGHQIGKTIAEADQEFGTTFQTKYTTCRNQWERERAVIDKKWAKMYKGVPQSKWGSIPEYHEEIRELSNRVIAKPMFNLFVTFLKKAPTNKSAAYTPQHKVMRELFVKARSIHPLSSKHIIVD